MDSGPAPTRKGFLARRALLMAGTFCLWAGLLFGAAGTAGYARGWLYLALYGSTILVSFGVARRKNPQIIIARARNRKDAKPFDRRLMKIYTVLMLAIPVVAGLDAGRFHWSAMSGGAAVAGVILFIAGSGPIVWALATNPFAETQVRIQSDRGHRVVSSGPYGYVRHPMYTGFIGQSIAIPLILGSMWAFVPAGLIVALFVYRTGREDRTLRAELPGYDEYARRVVYRLAPGVW